jgi:hypothetical protein
MLGPSVSYISRGLILLNPIAAAAAADHAPYLTTLPIQLATSLADQPVQICFVGALW